MSASSTGSNTLIEGELNQRLKAVEDLLSCDAIAYLGPITDIAASFFKMIVEEDGFQRHDKLVVLLETNGGFVEEAERLVNIIRHHYSTVDFIVATHAMSAGTVLVMSGDDIYMDYSAMLGPIDPQVMRAPSQSFVPALGYLEQYERLIARSAKGELTSAELAYLIEKFDPAELYQYEQAKDLSIALLEEWLVKYKFKNWTQTATRKEQVTVDMKKQRAKDIASLLNDTRRWHSHNRGISMEIVREELQLRIEDIEDVAGLKDALTSYTSLLFDYTSKLGHSVVAGWANGYHGH